MTTIWAVTEGDYSDYRVNGVFAKKEDAETYAAVSNSTWEERQVAEWVLVEELGDKYEHVQLNATVTRNDPVDIQESVDIRFVGVEGPPIPEATNMNVMLSWPLTKQDTVFLSMNGTDKVRLHKAMSEKIAQVKAEFDIIVTAEQRRRTGNG